MRTTKKDLGLGNQLGTRAIIAGFAMLGATIANAADITEEKPYLNHTDFESRWSGNYVGISLGATAAVTDIDRGSGRDNLAIGEGSFSAGTYVGFNREIGNSGFLWGGELGVSAFHADRTKSDTTLGSATVKANGLGEARLRLGYGWDKLHLYTTVGLAVSDIRGFGDKEKDELRLGIAYGAGMEVALSDTWSARIEALGYDFGRTEETYNGSKRDTDLGIGTVRIGLTRKF